MDSHSLHQMLEKKVNNSFYKNKYRNAGPSMSEKILTSEVFSAILTSKALNWTIAKNMHSYQKEKGTGNL